MGKRCLALAAVVAAGVPLGLPARASAQARPAQLADMALQVRLSDPQLSPDGRSVLLVRTRPDFERNEWVGRLVVLSTADGEARALTEETGRVSSPRWSPSGDRVAFLRPDSAGKAQVHVLSAAGGASVRLTAAARGVVAFAWRPDGAALAYVTEDVPAERSGQARHDRSFEAGDNVYLATEAAQPLHVWLVSSSGGAARRLTSGIAGVASGRPDLAWSPDGRYLAFLATPRPESGEMAHSRVELLDVSTGVRRTVAGSAAFSVWIGFSPDSRLLAFKRERGDVPGFTPAGIFVVPLDALLAGNGASAARDVSAAIDRDILAARWLPSGKGLLLQGQDGTNNVLWLQPLQGAPRRIELGALQPGEVSVGAGGQIALVASQSSRPDELYLTNAAGGAPRRLTDVNAALAALRLGRVDTLAWTGPEGQHENGVVTYPPDFDPARRYPLVLNIHGGPMMASTRVFSLRDQLLAARGWVVFNPNYRGSSALGAAYERAIVNDPGDGPGRDVMAGVAALAAAGHVDTARMAVSGWSYGGFMTTWLLGHYPVWRAGVAGAAVTDWLDYYNLADNNIWVAYGLGGSPWTGRADVYRAGSPISYAPHIRAPTLILSNTADPRVPVTQSYKLYHALKDNGVETKLVLYPAGGHVPSEPVAQRDVNRRWIEWLEEHLAPEKAAPR